MNWYTLTLVNGDFKLGQAAAKLPADIVWIMLEDDPEGLIDLAKALCQISPEKIFISGNDREILSQHIEEEIFFIESGEGEFDSFDPVIHCLQDIEPIAFMIKRELAANPELICMLASIREMSVLQGLLNGEK